MSDATSGKTWQTFRRLAVAARRAGNSQAARRHLRAAMALDPTRKVKVLQILRAELLLDQGDSARAERILKGLYRRHPRYIWAPLRLAELARDRGDTRAAERYVQAAEALDPMSAVSELVLLRSDLLSDAGHTAEAEALLATLVADHPDHTAALLRLAELARGRKDLDEVRTRLEAAINAGASGLETEYALARTLLSLGAYQDVVARLETLRRDHPGHPDLLLLLARAWRGLGRQAEEQKSLVAAIEADPLNPRMLRYLYFSHASALSPEQIETIGALLAARIDARLSRELEARALLRTMQFEAALDRLRNLRRRRNASQARELAEALLGAHRYRAGLRYVRACQRRWPADARFLKIYVQTALKLGLLDEVDQQLATHGAQLPEHEILPLRFLLCGYRGDLEGAVTCYERLKTLGRLRKRQRHAMTMLIFTRANLTEADALFDRIGHPLTKEDGPHARVGLIGQMLLEINLEQQAWAEAGGYARTADWARDRPRSAIPAIRLIDVWCAQDCAQDPVPERTSKVPRRIVQYWDSPKLPDGAADMVKSWAGVPGVDHQLYDRKGAQAFLRAHFDASWITAFNLANNPAQEADLFRLCALAQSGGVYADTDDLLYGDLDKLLTAGPGLILYREPLDGAIGNNFIAAPPRHPVIAYTARLVCNALLQRSSETTWNKTGPGVLVRAVGQYLLHVSETEARRNLTILDWPQIAAHISMHNPLPHKTTARYWKRTGRTQPVIAWDRLQKALQGSPAVHE